MRMRQARRLLTLCASTGLVVSAVTTGSNVAAQTAPTDFEFADAVGISLLDLEDVSLDGDNAGYAIIAESVSGFPTEGDDFLVISTGRASDATTPNSSGSLSTTLSGPNNSQGNDSVAITFQLNPPIVAPDFIPPTCASFDFKFLSEEFPEFVGSSFNDAFTAEAGVSELSIVGNTVFAPRNFAFDAEENPISVNTAFGLAGGTGTTYDGATPTLKARTPVVLSQDGFVIVLTVQDVGDSSYDSAVFVDNFQWEYGSNCEPGASIGDSDGDGLLDSWETDGLDFDGDGIIDLDLPAMGATPDHKDLFLEVDWMKEDPGFCALVCFGGHSHEPPGRLKELMIEIFDIAPVSNPDGVDGVRLHFDAGSDSVMNPDTGEKWGDRSRADKLDHDNELGAITDDDRYQWADFSAIREANFEPARRAVFHYVVFAHEAGGDNADGLLGIARGIPGSDFIVFDHSIDGDNTTRIATTLHEFGHTLGLFHGGDQPIANGKPNYLSVMNYSFSFDGLIENGKDSVHDLSRRTLDDLDENSLDESVGLDLSDIKSSKYYCDIFVVPDPSDPDIFGAQPIQQGGGPVDWNCDGDTDDVVSANINALPLIGSVFPETLTGFNDWANLRFDGGAVGRLQSPDLPDETETDEGMTRTGRDALTRPYAPRLVAPELVRMLPASATVLNVELTNAGTEIDTITIETSSESWVTSQDSSELTLEPGATQNVAIVVEAPDEVGASTTFEITATSAGNTNRTTSEQIEVETVDLTSTEAATELEAAVDALEPGAFKSPGNYNAFTTQASRALDDLAIGRTQQGEQTLANLLNRLDGCANTTSAADNNDWVVSCTTQLALRALIGANLTQ